jgi:hypothetical protein
MDRGPRVGSPRTYADDEQAQKVGRSCSTREVSEQGRASGGGGDGGKETGQRKPAKGNLRHKTRPGLSAGKARPVRWSGYVWQLAGIGRCGSPRSCITSTTLKR